MDKEFSEKLEKDTPTNSTSKQTNNIADSTTLEKLDANNPSPPEVAVKTVVASTPYNIMMPSPTSKTLNDETYKQNLMMPDSVWPPPITISADATPYERFYIENRWYSEWSYNDNIASANKNQYLYLQRILVIGSVILPILVSYRVNNIFMREIFYYVSIGISLMIAIASGLENLFKYGQQWTSRRDIAEDLQYEKQLYDYLIGPYDGHEDPFSLFVERCEDIFNRYGNRNTKIIDQQTVATEEMVQSVLSKYNQKDVDTKNGSAW